MLNVQRMKKQVAKTFSNTATLELTREEVVTDGIEKYEQWVRDFGGKMQAKHGDCGQVLVMLDPLGADGSQKVRARWVP